MAKHYGCFCVVEDRRREVLPLSHKMGLTMFLSCLLSLVMISCSQPSPRSGEMTVFLDAYNDSCHRPYSGAIMVVQSGDILLEDGYGMADHKTGTPNSPETVFAIGSITKSFTALGIMQLQEQGLLSVHDPVNTYLEGYTRDDGVTLHHLLTHTASLPREGLFRGSDPVSLDEQVEYINQRHMLFETAPGEHYVYSNAGYILLAAVIEQVSGQTYHEYMEEHILAPLGMNRSSSGTDTGLLPGQALGYDFSTGAPRLLSRYHFSSIVGSGNLYSTVEDLYKYHVGLQENSLLSETSTQELFSPHQGDGQDGYGYGWEITQLYGRQRFSHGGSIGNSGYKALMIRYPTEDAVLIFLSNDEDHRPMFDVAESLEAILFQKPYVLPATTPPAPVDPVIVQSYAGSYQLPEGPVFHVRFEDGALYSTADDGNDHRLIPLSDTRFYFENSPCVQAEFIQGAEGEKLQYRIQNKTRIFTGDLLQ